MKRILSAAMALFIAVLVIGGTHTSTVNAQSTGLGITPRRDLVIVPGNDVTDKLFVSNLDSDQALTLSLQVIDFGASDETGTPSLRLNEDDKQTAWSLKPFVTAPQTIELKGGESKYVEYSVNIPEGQGAGSYYSAIRYVAEATNGGNVNITASGATLVFVTVPGATKESLVLQKFGAYDIKGNEKNGKYRSLFVKQQPDKLAFTVKNQGNVAEQPTGSVLIKNMFGKQVAVVKDINSKSSLALIDQTRRFDFCIEEKESKANDDSQRSTEAAQGQECVKQSFIPGRYTMELAGFYGINGNATQDITGSASFWYLPVWFLIVMGVVILAIAGGAFMLYRKFTGRGSFKNRKK